MLPRARSRLVLVLLRAPATNRRPLCWGRACAQAVLRVRPHQAGGPLLRWARAPLLCARLGPPAPALPPQLEHLSESCAV